MSKNLVQAKLVNKEELIPGIFKFAVESKELVDSAKPGQFLEIRVTNDVVPFLRRPISIHKIDKENNVIEFIFQVKGKGTEILSTRNIGDEIDILGPLGNGIFDIKNYKNIAIIGGGIGIFPLYELVKSAPSDVTTNTYLGFRNKELVTLEKEFKEASSYFVLTTDDGSYGENGFAINFLRDDIESRNIDAIFACGPMPMLRAVKKLAEEKNIPCQISLEERMACGVGVCLGCAVKTAASPADAPEYIHVCKAGPVFDAKIVEI